MGLFDRFKPKPKKQVKGMTKIGGEIIPCKNVTPSIQASVFDTANTTEYNSRNWANAVNVDAAADANDKTERRKLRDRSRYTVVNNSYANAIVRNLGNDMVGPGVRLQKPSDDPRAAEKEREWHKWVEKVDLNETLRIMRSSRAADGEVFAVGEVGPEIGNVSGLRVRLYPADRVTSDEQASSTHVDGINFDSQGNPESYEFVINPAVPSAGSTTIEAEKVIHYAFITMPGQVRGIPELTPSLDKFQNLREFSESVLRNANLAANISGFVTTDSELVDESGNPITPPESIELTPGSILTLPKNYDFKAFKPEQPMAMMSEYQRLVLSECFRSVNMPYNVGAADSSEHNYSSGRLDDQAYRRQTSIDQAYAANNILDIIYAWWHQDMYNRPDDYENQWYWPVREHIDPNKEANAAATRLESGVTNLQIESAKLGLDWRDVAKGAVEVDAFISDLEQEAGLSFEEDDENEG